LAAAPDGILNEGGFCSVVLKAVLLKPCRIDENRRKVLSAPYPVGSKLYFFFVDFLAVPVKTAK
jgi:hypothetical protein